MLTREQIAYYHEHGFLRIPEMFTPEETDELSDELDRLVHDLQGPVAVGVENGLVVIVDNLVEHNRRPPSYRPLLNREAALHAIRHAAGLNPLPTGAADPGGTGSLPNSRRGCRKSRSWPGASRWKGSRSAALRPQPGE